MTLLVALIALGCGLLALHQAAPGRPIGPSPETYPVAERRLDNGLGVLVHEAPGTRVACAYLFVKAGSRFEREGATGVSHLIEHLMFRGTKRFPSGSFDRILESCGGESNAYTGHDVTVYHESFPPDALGTVLDMELDRLAHTEFSEVALDKERTIILEERKMDLEDSGYGRMLETLYREAFRVHPYRHPVMGSVADLEAMTIEKCQSYFHRHYSPPNMTLVVAGDVRTDATLREIDRRFSTLPAASLDAVAIPEEPPQTAVRSATVSAPAEFPSVLVGYRIPGFEHDDLPALDAVETILGLGPTCRLHRHLVEDTPVALDFEVDADELIDPGLLAIYLQAREGVSVDRLVERLDEQIARLRDEPVTEAEIEKFRRVTLVDHLGAFKTVSGRAELLGTYAALCDGPDELYRVPEYYMAITPDDIQRVARKYLDPRARTRVDLVPLPEDDEEGAEDDANEDQDADEARP